MMLNAHDRQERGGAMERDHVIAVIFPIDVMDHGPHMMECPNREFPSWDFGRRTNKVPPALIPLGRN